MNNLLKRIRGSSDVVGLDIGTHSVKLARLRRERGAWRLVSLSSGQLPPDAIVEGRIHDLTVVTERVRELVKQAGVENMKTALAISGGGVIIKKLSLPEQTRAELDESTMREAEQYIPFDIKDVNVDTHILNPQAGQNQMDVLLVAAKKDVINEYVSVAANAGLKPVVVDVSLFAAVNAFKMSYDVLPEDTVAVVDIGAGSIKVGVIANGLLAFSRDIGIGGSHLTAEIQKELGMSYEEAEFLKIGLVGQEPGHLDLKDAKKFHEIVERVSDLMVTEIQRSLDLFVATNIQSDIKRVYLTGGSSVIPEFISSLERRLEVPAVPLDPLRNLAVNATQFDMNMLMDSAPSIAVALGLATRRPDDFSYGGVINVNLIGKKPGKERAARFALPNLKSGEVLLPAIPGNKGIRLNWAFNRKSLDIRVTWGK